MLNQRARRLRVLVLVPYPVASVPGQRFRIEQWQPRLAQDGIDLEIAPMGDERLLRVLHATGRLVGKAVHLLRGLLSCRGDVRRATRYDVVVVYRAASIVGPAIVEPFLAGRRPVVFDFDDAIFLTDTRPENRRFGWLKFAGKTATICRVSSHVVVGNQFLKSYATRHNKQVTIVPSSVDTDRYTPSTDGTCADRRGPRGGSRTNRCNPVELVRCVSSARSSAAGAVNRNQYGRLLSDAMSISRARRLLKSAINAQLNAFRLGDTLKVLARRVD
jgi:hypothetical protein